MQKDHLPHQESLKINRHGRDIWYKVYNIPSHETGTRSVLKQMGMADPGPTSNAWLTHLVHMDRVGTGQDIKPEGGAWRPPAVILHRLEKRIQTKSIM